MYPISHYIFNQSTCVAAWLTVSVAVERYLSVCRATTGGASICYVGRARCVSVVVFATMSAAAIPSALRYVRVPLHDPDTDTEGEMSYGIELSTLGKNETFMTMYQWVQNLLRSIIPLAALLVLNSCIILSLRRKRRVTSKNWHAKNRITFMLLVVIVVFSVCVLPDAVLSTCFRIGYADEKVGLFSLLFIYFFFIY